ncbi:amino acid adenylation domain-containing protein [Pseudonocardiaceae bacterium YIM PH 21723]|nr:amino acid adenylation domain-containing protein [Pseudonocardiaceae bacterium YIM PH 21723]
MLSRIPANTAPPELSPVIDLCLHHIFEEQVDKSPDALALLCGSREFTYSELDIRANRLAHSLLENGVGPGTFVAIYCDRSELPIIGILACHKIGAPYVPIDPSYPGERIAHIIGELGVKFCLTDHNRSQAAVRHFTDVHRMHIDEPMPAPDHRPAVTVDPDELAYVIYTSGTTGRPKGVMTAHRHVSRFVVAFNEACATGPDDRVLQGFSLSFDGSVEEIWMAFSNGSALIVPTADAPKLGEELAVHLDQLGITYFSTVPTLLSTLGQDVPSLRTVVLSGEVCRPELITRFSRPGLRILNVYGPTEATVNTTVKECHPGEPVTIGRPLRGYGIHIVDEHLRPVPPGETGELLVSGETLAHGYVDQPELTAKAFLTDHDGTRYYRTGDLVRWTEDGELEFFGRMDGQVKIRGFRVELAEIESVLLELPQVREASVRLLDQDGLQELAAYVVPVDRSEPPAPAEVLALLESRLPAYMVPGFLDPIPALPRTTSGKVDRSALPAPRMPLIRAGTVTVPPETDLEILVADVWSEILGLPITNIDDDFFTDLGGHSLVAARMVTLLRDRQPHPVTVRDAYAHPTVRRLAAQLTQAAPERPPAPRPPIPRVSRVTRIGTGIAQFVSLYLLAIPVAIPLCLFILLEIEWTNEDLSTSDFLAGCGILAVGTWPALLLLSIVVKWLVLGRIKPGEHRLWGWYYWRWWLVKQMSFLSGATALQGTPLLPLYYRLMGARIGARCTVDTTQCFAWDLISIGSHTSVGADTHLLGCRVEQGMLRLGRIDIGDRCFVGIHSALGLDTRMGDDSALDDQSLLPDGQAIPAGEAWRGSPATRGEVPLPQPAGRQSAIRRFVFGALHLAAVILLGVVIGFLPLLVFLAIPFELYETDGLAEDLLLTVLAIPFGIIAYCGYIALLKRVVSMGIRPGSYPVLSWAYLRKWLADSVMAFSKPFLLPVYTTMFLPPLLRLMGARIGRHAEISTVWKFAPELIDVAEESFFADGSIIGGRRVHLGSCEIARNRIGRRSFVGNSAILPVGADLPDGCLLGVQSLAGRHIPAGTEWLGSPAFRLTHRVKVESFSAGETYRPTPSLYGQRAVIDGMRVLLPFYLLLLAAALPGWVLTRIYDEWDLWPTLAVAPVAGLLGALVAACCVAGLKNLVFGAFQPEVKPLWCRYVWLNEMINGCYESVAAPVLSVLLGTPFAAPLLRLMGCRIGRGVYLGTTLFSEFDLVEIGDRAELNHGVVVQNHLFEDRVFKSSNLVIGAEATVGNLGVILYDSVIEPGAVVGPLSLLMKGETLSRDTRWHGIPTAPAP